MLLRLLQTAPNVDIGIAQISSQHLGWLARHHQIQPRDLLEPCVNLCASSLILHTTIQKHGRTWRPLPATTGRPRTFRPSGTFLSACGRFWLLLRTLDASAPRYAVTPSIRQRHR